MPINNHSEIIKYITENLGETVTFQEVKDLMKEFNIKCKQKDSRIIFNYTIGADFANPVVQEARGIIMDTGSEDEPTSVSDWRIVAWAFDKFGNYGESYAADIDWHTAQIQEKEDGSLLKLYRFHNIWRWSTMSTIEAEDAETRMTGRTFLDIIKSADNYNIIDYSKLDKHKTYIFELVSPENKVVVDYPCAHLYHIGTRSNLTGVEFDDNIGIEKPQIYNIEDANLEKVVEAAKNLNNGVCEHEGFVVRDANFNRIKVKNPEYLMLHHSLTTDSIAKDTVIEALIYNDEEKIAAMLSYPHFKVQFKWYDYQYTKFLYDLTIYVNAARNLYSSLLENRKNFAITIQYDKFKSFGFIAIDNPNMSAEDMVKNVGVKRIAKFIEEQS